MVEINIYDYVVKEMMILIPVLYILGMFFKASKLKDEYIPMVLLILAIIMATCINGFNIYSFLQGILTAGCSVFINQIVVQNRKMDV